ncbi:MAG: riboflavin biosynthesis protein RibF [Ruminococcaceae bacterium]|nr:riboflavin biosynthesis protein RibF [Oscillospiraceae bacterium]
MKIYRYTPGTDLGQKTVVALGFFDGVHEGHRRLLATARDAAEKNGLRFTVFTFESKVGFKGNSVIYSTEEKMSIFESLGVETVVLADFSEISSICAEKFVKDCLFRDMGCRLAVAGSDFCYGKGRGGNSKTLADTLRTLGAECIIEEEHKIDGEKISTTKIKELLALGRVKEASKYLGFPYHIVCGVERGRGVGRSLGFPTVNSKLESTTAELRRGVYRTAVEIEGKLYTGVTNIGTCPTFAEREIHAETYIVNYSGNLYGEKIRIFFLGYLREEKKFESPNELIMQINVDKKQAIQENGDLTWQAIGQN